LELSVFTPVHKSSSPYLRDAYRKLQEQTYADWEWLIGVNNGGSVPGYIRGDDRVRVIDIPDELAGGRNKIGRLKKTLALEATGEVLVELDADDMLTVNALDRVAESFADSDVHMAYSNSAEFIDRTWEPFVYSSDYGWQSRAFEFEGHQLKEMVAFSPSPHSFRRVEWSPNHVRCFRTSSYFNLGGHDETMPTADDHDLNCRFFITYGAAGIRHIDECLYLYRRHPSNTSVTDNAEVQYLTDQNYLKYSRDMAIRWAKDNKLRLLDLGGRFNAWPGFTTVDKFDADVKCDLNKRWPFADGSVGVIKAYHIFEHLKDPIFTMGEAYRVLAPGGWLLIEVPSTDGRGAFQDPTHVSRWNSNSLWYYTNENWARFIRPKYKGRFQISRIVNYYPTSFEETHKILICQADLIALKPPYDERPPGEILI
jgi:SAM-dependent methyltransferase